MDATSNNLRPAGLQTISAREDVLLASYAMRSADSRGRKHPEPEHAYRGPFQRDRDRVLHSAAYRRLSGKMQVFTGDMGDYHRTRLTHTHEVASIARTIGRALRLNEDLIEALALFHDIGHPPFGHAGEDALDECLKSDGGFSHNQYALTLAEVLESRHHPFPGLNLTFEVLQSQATRIDKSGGQQRLMEAQVVECADSTAYDAHDTDDAVKLGLVSLDELGETTLVREAIDKVRSTYQDLDAKMLRKAVVHQLIDRQVSSVLEHCGARLSELGFVDSHAARTSEFVVAPDDDLAEQKQELEAFLYARVYRHPQLVQVRADAQHRLRAMFEGFLARPDRMPPKYQHRAEVVGPRRAVGEYLAGMTDRFCDEQFQLFT